MLIFFKSIKSTRLKVLLAGAVSVAFSYTAFLALVSLGVHYQIASIVNFLVYLIINFKLNRNWSFKSSGNMKKQVRSHMSLHLGNQVMIMIGLFLLVEKLDIMAGWAQIIMQVMSTTTAFILTPLIFKEDK